VTDGLVSSEVLLEVSDEEVKISSGDGLMVTIELVVNFFILILSLVI